MQYNEALYFINFRRFSHYDGYLKTLKFKCNASDKESRRDFVAIDALKFGAEGSKKRPGRTAT